jgi:CheY-like chemotaxis protein
VSDGPGRGSEFVIELPSAPDHESEATAETGAPNATASTSPVRVLVVDDNEDAALALGEALRTLGHEVRVAHDGPQALGLARSFHADVALLDIGLPVMDGHELARALRSVWQDRAVRFIAISGYGQQQDIARSMASGFDAHLVKPVPVARLVDLLRR